MIRKPKKGRLYTSYRQYTNSAVQKAILEIVEKGISIRSASEKYGVPKSTLNDRLQKSSTENAFKLIQLEEEHLAEATPTPVRLCIVCRCRRSAERRFHRFPESEKRKKQWLEVLQLEQTQITSNSSVCSRHFRPEDYCYKKSVLSLTGKKKSLRTDAVPSLFLDVEDKKISVYIVKPEISDIFTTEKEDSIPSTSEMNQIYTDNDEEPLSMEDILHNAEQIESFIEPERTQKSSSLSKNLKNGTLNSKSLEPTEIEILQKVHIKRLEKRIAEAEARVKELENFHGKGKNSDTWNSNNKGTEILQTADVKRLETQLAEEEGKVEVLESNCKNLLNIVKHQKETINYLTKKLKSSEREKSKIQSIKVQEIVTTVAMHNQKSKEMEFSDDEEDIETKIKF